LKVAKALYRGKTWISGYQVSSRLRVWLAVAMVVMIVATGCRDSSDQPTSEHLRQAPDLSYVGLIPSLLSMGRILGDDDKYLHRVRVDGVSSLIETCPKLHDDILGIDYLAAMGTPEYLPSFRGVRLEFSYGGFDPVMAQGEVLVAQSPVTDGTGTVNDFMATVLDYPCQDSLAVASMPANEAVVMYPNLTDVVVPIEGLSDRMVGYEMFELPDTADPVFQTSAPVSSLVLQGWGTVEVYDQMDGYFIYVGIGGRLSPVPDQSWISLDRIVDLILAIEDRVRENHFEVEADGSTVTCRAVMSQLLEEDPATSTLNDCELWP